MCSDLVYRKHTSRQVQATHAMLRKENANVQQRISPARQGNTAESPSSVSSTVSRQPFQAIQPSPTLQPFVSSSHAAHLPAQKSMPNGKGADSISRNSADSASSAQRFETQEAVSLTVPAPQQQMRHVSEATSAQQRIAGGLEHAVPAASQDPFSALTDSPVAVAGQAVAADCDKLSCSSLSATNTASKAQVHAWHPTDAQQASASADNSDTGMAAEAVAHSAAPAVSATRAGTSHVPDAAATQLGDSAACEAEASAACEAEASAACEAEASAACKAEASAACEAQPNAASGSCSTGTHDLRDTTATSEDRSHGPRTADATIATNAVPDNATSKADDAPAEALRASKPRGAGKVQKQAKARGSTVEVNLLVKGCHEQCVGPVLL